MQGKHGSGAQGCTGWCDQGLFAFAVLCQRPELVPVEQERNKEKFWPVFTWQETAVRSEEAHTARESRSARALAISRVGQAGGPASLPIPASTEGLISAGLCLSRPFRVSGHREHGPEISFSHSEITSRSGVRSVWNAESAHLTLHGPTSPIEWDLPTPRGVILGYIVLHIPSSITVASPAHPEPL